MRPLLRFSVHNPWLVLAAVAAITLAACLFIPRVRLQLDARSLIPIHEAQLAASDNAAGLFGLRDVAMIGVANERRGIYNPDTLARIARLSESLSSVDGIDPASVTSLASAPRLFIEEGEIDLHPLLARDGSLDAQTIDRLRRETESTGINDGVLVARDGRAAAILAEVRPDADRRSVLSQVRGLVAGEAGGEDSIYLSGTALAQAVLGQSAALDLARLVPAVIVVLFGVLIIAFRSVVPAIACLAEIGVSLLWTVGLMGLTEESVFVTTLVMPVILIAVGVSDDVYALKHCLRSMNGAPTRQKMIAAFSEVIHPISLTAISTIIGLLSLAATSLEPLRVFGIFGAVSIIFSTLFSFTLVPAMMVLMSSRLPVKQAGSSNRASGAMLTLLRGLATAGPRRVLLSLLLAAVLALILMTKLRVDDNWIKNLPGASDIVQGDRSLNDLMAGTTTIDLMVDSGQSDGFLDPEALAALGAAEDAVAAQPSVGAVQSIFSDVVRINASLRGSSYSQYREDIVRGRLKLNREEIEQSLLLMSSARRTPLGERLDSKYQRARMTVFIRSADYERIQGVLQAASVAGLSIRRANEVVTPFGDGWISYLAVQLLVEGQVYSIALAILADLLLLSLLLKSARAGLIAILPVVFSVLVVFAGLAATKTPLGVANSMFAGIAIGIGLDFSIHLTSAYRKEMLRGSSLIDSLKRAVVRTGPAIVTSAAAITAGFSVLLLSEVAPNAQLGMMICLSLVICATATLILIPSLVLSRAAIRIA